MRARFNPYKECHQKAQSFHELVTLAEAENDGALLPELEQEGARLEKDVSRLEMLSLFDEPYDASGAIFSIHAGAGGTEACDWVDMLLRLYARWCDAQGYKVEMVDFTPGDEAGKRSVTLVVDGKFAYGKLKNEKGVHRLVRISPFDANKRRHTSFAAVDVIPEVEAELDVQINPSDLRIDTFRASGAGGQHVNKTSSAVRITHIPTGTVVSCQAERSQHRNKDVAMKILKSRLMRMLEEEHKEKIEELRGEAKDIAWGNQIRSYVFQPYQMVKDHRTNQESGNVQKVMDGDIDGFIDAALRWQKGQGK